MGGIGSATSGNYVGIEYHANDEAYNVTGGGTMAQGTMGEDEVNGLLSAYGLQVVNGNFTSVDGFKVTGSNSAAVGSFGGSPPLPNTKGEADAAILGDRLGWLMDAGDGALMWLALSEMARTSMRDMVDAKAIKRAMSKGKLDAQKNELDATEKRIAAQREEAYRNFQDTVVTAVVICAVSCAAACAGAWGSAISSCVTCVAQVYKAYSDKESKLDGSQRKADDKELEAMRWQLQSEMMDQMIDEAQSNYEESKELFKLAMRILIDHYELQTQATQTYTRG